MNKQVRFMQSIGLVPIRRRTGEYKDDLIASLLLYYQLSEETLKSETRRREVVEARRIFCYIMRRYDDHLTLRRIGEMIGISSHATVLHHIRVAESFLVYDKQFKNDVEQVTRIANAEVLNYDYNFHTSSNLSRPFVMD